jgi:TRAP-type C4-dicarboxylate transport system permease small subunit
VASAPVQVEGGKNMKMLKTTDRIVGKFLKWSSVSLLTIVFLLLIANVFFRFFPIVSFGWFDEVIEMLIAWMVFLGTAALWRENDHFTITFLPELCQGKKIGFALDIAVNLVCLAFIAVFTYYSINLTLRAADWTPVINMPKKLLYASMPISGCFMVVYSLRNIFVSSAKMVK